uniref:Uncharacterized protein n=1 Tax=viral metagenome TaxID=1070528 RepID=A0A6C0ETY8_9ZZZZ
MPQPIEYEGPCDHCLFCQNDTMPESYVCQDCADEKIADLIAIINSASITG